MAEPAQLIPSLPLKPENRQDPNNSQSSHSDADTKKNVGSENNAPIVQGSEPHADLDEIDDDYADGPLDDSDLSKFKKYWDERSCTVEEKELSDLVRKGLLDDETTEEMKGDFTMNDLPQLHGDEACRVQWSTQKRNPKHAIKFPLETLGLTDDELASIMEACPDLELQSR